MSSTPPTGARTGFDGFFAADSFGLDTAALFAVVFAMDLMVTGGCNHVQKQVQCMTNKLQMHVIDADLLLAVNENSPGSPEVSIST
ncbi:MAG: hypothetical protein V4614_10505 [Pseudomonadota bacterium]